MFITFFDGARRAWAHAVCLAGRLGGVPAILAIALLALSLLTGCKSADTHPTIVRLTMRASPTMNRDTSGRPSPIAVRIYELKSAGTMDRADFFSLQSKEQEALGADLNTRHDYMLRPGDTMTLEQTLQPDTRYVAFVAAYREIERSRWRAVHPVTPHKKTALGLRVDDLDVTIGPP
ncbi:type VI secretion system lipoprotein TssJ [Caballeronia sp. BR00000012568055]|uniref:type VI secretion system lipoprotein TssJ n=1 Tax=Caballeronia sp. BR00000012568055 TaxID=2918761 RepID=UPI0023F8BBE6|nr:type VI secretion system lipoprotein TssJ [Caballeronia sp. BR00000012568055]